ncbi:MAG: hypothetical protein KF754_00625 [Planctomycetes bacterium]|nr:hypothetical protein [Planctomycetota bacterium]
MWLFTTLGFFSATCARKSAGKGAMDPDLIQVRARVRQHLVNLQKFLPDLLGHREILELGGTDYRYRVILPKKDWSAAVAAMSNATAYGNFKNTCHTNAAAVGDGYVHALHMVWSTMFALQQSPAGTPAEPTRAVEFAEPPPPIWETGDADTDTNAVLSLVPGALHNPGRWDWSESPSPEMLAAINFGGRKEPSQILALAASIASPRPVAFTLDGGLENPMRVAFGYLKPSQVIETAVDLALAELVVKRKWPLFSQGRLALLQLRKFAQRQAPPESAQQAADLLFQLSKPDGDTPEGAHLPHALVHALLLGAVLACKPGEWRKYAVRAHQLNSHGHMCHDAPEAASTTHVAYILFWALGRCFGDVPTGREILATRLRVAAVEAAAMASTDASFVPESLATGTTAAAEFMQQNQIHPAIRADGAGQFAFPLGASCTSGQGHPRVVLGYGFRPDGEAVYIVPDGQTLTDKRCWKAHAEYKLDTRPENRPDWGIGHGYVRRVTGQYHWGQ